jgi:hypothetical protein
VSKCGLSNGSDYTGNNFCESIHEQIVSHYGKPSYNGIYFMTDIQK